MNLPGTSLLLLVVSSTSAAAGAPSWVSEGPYLDDEDVFIELPLEVGASMLFVEIELGGAPRRFLFDTGSPSMMSSALAAELGLEVIDKRQGRDSHGAVIDTDIVQSDLVLGGTTFRKVPIFVADFPMPVQCLFDGVLGSEVLPLCAWQIDLPDSRLRCSTDLSKLQHVGDAARQPLHTFGYPHAPILDVRLADNAASKAMFDTGSPEYLAISPPDFDGARRNDGVARTVDGEGSLGGSLGGVAPQGDQLKVQLSDFSIADLRLGRVDAPLRESPPSLVGTGVLQHFVVTLDTRNSAAYFDGYRGGPYLRPSYGFGLDFDGGVAVSLVWDDSPAKAAGLRPGQQITAINGASTGSSCDDVRGVMQAMSEGNSIDLAWDDGGATLQREQVESE